MAAGAGAVPARPGALPALLEEASLGRLLRAIPAESFLAGTASCRVAVEGVDEQHRALRPLGILHPNAPPRDQWYGTREFAVLDPDRNPVACFECR